MVKEVYDKNSGAILFKKDKEGKLLEKLASKVSELEKRIQDLEEKLNNK